METPSYKQNQKKNQHICVFSKNAQDLTKKKSNLKIKFQYYIKTPTRKLALMLRKRYWYIRGAHKLVKTNREKIRKKEIPHE